MGENKTNIHGQQNVQTALRVTQRRRIGERRTDVVMRVHTPTIMDSASPSDRQATADSALLRCHVLVRALLRSGLQENHLKLSTICCSNSPHTIHHAGSDSEGRGRSQIDG